jgi:hypothetical protein
MKINNYLFIGHSHTQAIYDASIENNNIIDWGFMDPIDGFGPIQNLDGRPHLLPIIKDSIISKSVKAKFIVSTIGGNAHNFYGLIKNPVPFDFDSPVIIRPRHSDCQYIPYNNIKESFKRKIYNGDISMLQGVLNDNIIVHCHIESPPPIRDNNVIMSLLDDYFIKKYPNVEIADPWFRLKFWKLHSNIYQEYCKRNNILFIESPVAALDEHGFLKYDYLSKKSSTHANSDYGKLVLNQLDNIL